MNLKDTATEKPNFYVHEFCVKHGICTVCKSNWATDGSPRCAACRIHARDYHRDMASKKK